VAGQWLHLAVTSGWDVVVPLASASRLLHRGDPDFALWADEAVSLADRLGVEADPTLPGVVVLAADGERWLVGDARVDPSFPGTFHPVPAWLFERQPAWCRGVLVREGGWSFVADPAAWGVARG